VRRLIKANRLPNRTVIVSVFASAFAESITRTTARDYPRAAFSLIATLSSRQNANRVKIPGPPRAPGYRFHSSR
jgi:hypothetical protein